MKIKSLVFSLIFGLIIYFGAGCSDPVSKRITGIWFIEDIRVSGDTSMLNTEQFRSSIEDQKRLRFELNEDSSMSIYTGSSEINGLWRYDKKSSQVFVTLEGNIQPTVLGKYQDGKLINNDTIMAGAVISTVFVKMELEE